ncbi:beta strand repeat-containing protein [Kaarinaea lacus]
MNHTSLLRKDLRHRFVAMALGTFLSSFTTVAVLAGPQGGQVVQGQGNIQQSDSNTTVINQNSQSMAINWDSFNVDANEHVQFVQPSSSAAVLNRIQDQNASQIFGTIDANGQVFLINPNGIVFGESASVNVASLVASGLNLKTEDFMQGNYNFNAEEGSDGGVVVNRGVIKAATGGSVSLIGGAVDNQGVIVAHMGHINLGAGRSVVMDFDGDGLMRFEVDGELINTTNQVAAVTNSGELSADGGQVYLTAKTAQGVFDHVINNEGIIRAAKIERQGGVVRLVAEGGSVSHSGAIDASGKGGVGGTVEVLGDDVMLQDQASIDVSGDHGGGEILVGGDYQGQGDTKTATNTYVGEHSQLLADAYQSGDGGKVIVWADDTTEFHGQINARGGADAGDGGFAEVSGKKQVVVTGHADLRASNGNNGQMLIDPGTVNIVNGDTTDPLPPPNRTVINDAWIELQLSTGNLTIRTIDADTTISANEDILIDGDVSVTWTTNMLTLNAGRNITSNGAVPGTFSFASDSGGTLNLNFGQNDTGGELNLSSGSIGGVGNINISGGGGVATDRIVGSNISSNNWTITGIGSGTLNNLNHTFSEIESLQAGSSGDTFNFETGGSISDSVTGNIGADRFVFNGGNVAGTVDGGLGNNTLDFTNSNSAVTINLADGSATHINGGNANGFSNIQALVGGGGNDTLIGENNANTWSINTADSGTVDSVQFTNFSTLIGGTGVDHFDFAANGSVSVEVQGGGGIDILDFVDTASAETINLEDSSATRINSGTAAGFSSIEDVRGTDDTLVGASGGNTWAITGSNSGSVNGVAFTGMSTLTAGSGGDRFDFATGGSISNQVQGGAGTDTLDFIDTGSAETINLANNSATRIRGGSATGFNNIEDVRGTDDILVGGNGGNTWDITGGDSGNVGGITFSGMSTLTAGSGGDLFDFASGGSVSSQVLGGTGADTLDFVDTNSAETVNLADSSATRISGGSAAGFSSIEVVNGTGDTLVGANGGNTWAITGTNSGSVGGVTFSGMSTLTAGSGGDRFDFTYSGSISNQVQGGAGTDTLDFVDTGSAETVNLANNSATRVAAFTSIEAVEAAGGDDTLIGANDTNQWDITAVDQGSVDGVGFTNFSNLTGGSGDDTFNLQLGASVSGIVDGGGQVNGDSIVINDQASVSGNNYDLQVGSVSRNSAQLVTLTNVESTAVNAGSGSDVFNLAGGVQDINIDGAGGTDMVNVTADLNLSGNVTIAAEQINDNGGFTISANQLSIDGATVIGSSSNQLLTSVNTLSITNSNANAYITEDNGLNLSGINLGGSGNFYLTVNNGSITTNGQGITAYDFDVTANGSNASIGSDLNPLITNLSGSLTASAANGNGGVYITDVGSLTVDNIDAGTGSITLEAFSGDLNLGQLVSATGEDGVVTLTVHGSSNIVNQNNGYITADFLFVNLDSGSMGTLADPFFIEINKKTELTSESVFITSNSFTGEITPNIITDVGTILAQAQTGLSSVNKGLDLIDPSLFLVDINLFNVEETGIRLPADQVQE